MIGKPMAPRHPALQLHEPRLARWLALEGEHRLQALNVAAQAQALRNAFGGALRFEAAGPAQAAIDYEEAIAGEGHPVREGRIATRLSGADGLHDLFNALAWLRWPQTKALLNALHVAEIRAARSGARSVDPASHSSRSDTPTAGAPAVGGPRARSRARDRVTLFDENGLLLLCRDAALIEQVRRQDWPGLFVSGRARLQAADLLVFGHGLMHKCLQPFKAMTGRVLWLPLAPDAPVQQVDQAAAAALQTLWPDWPLPPLPICGWPGWAGQDQDAAFYDDHAVFRAPRSSTAIAGQVTKP